MDCSGGLESYGKRRRRRSTKEEAGGSYFKVTSGEMETTGVTRSPTGNTLINTENPVILLRSLPIPDRKASHISNSESVRRLNDKNLLPEHVDLGLRLTVGEDVVQKPFLPSSQVNGCVGNGKGDLETGAGRRVFGGSRKKENPKSIFFFFRINRRVRNGGFLIHYRLITD